MIKRIIKTLLVVFLVVSVNGSMYYKEVPEGDYETIQVLMKVLKEKDTGSKWEM